MSDSKAPPPTRPIDSATLSWTEYKDAENFHARYRHLSESMGPQPYKIGVAIEELMPGKQNNPAHYHMREEEHVLILEGELTVRIGKEFHVMTAGSYVRFPQGSPFEHCLYNHTDKVCRYIIIGDRDPHDVVIYPDSNKVAVRALNERYLREPKDYLHGEGGLTGKKP